MRLFFLAAGVLAAAGCSSDHTASVPENQLVANDFESLAGWVGESASLTQEKAHSGHYAIKTDKGVEYSLTYRNTLLKLSSGRVAKVRLTAYVLANQANSPAVLTLQITRSPQDATNVFSQGIEVSKAVKTPGQWTKISQDIALPATVTGTNELRLYLWQPGATGPVYVDDLLLEVEP